MASKKKFFGMKVDDLPEQVTINEVADEKPDKKSKRKRRKDKKEEISAEAPSLTWGDIPASDSAEDAAAVDDLAAVEAVESVENVESVEAVESVESVENVEAVESVESASDETANDEVSDMLSSNEIADIFSDAATFVSSSEAADEAVDEIADEPAPEADSELSSEIAEIFLSEPFQPETPTEETQAEETPPEETSAETLLETPPEALFEATDEAINESINESVNETTDEAMTEIAETPPEPVISSSEADEEPEEDENGLDWLFGGGADDSDEQESTRKDKNSKSKKSKEKKSKEKKSSKSAPIMIDPDDSDAAELVRYGKSAKSKRGKFFAFYKIPIRVYMILVCVFVVIIAGSSAVLFAAISNAASPPEHIPCPNTVYLDNSVPSSNAFNFIFTDIPVEFSDLGLIIRRFSFDCEGTIITFNRDFDFARADLRLIDSFGIEMTLDAAFIDGGGRAFFPDYTVRFSPISAGSAGFDLLFTDRATGEEAEVSFGFTQMHGLTNRRRFDRISTIRDYAGNILGAVHAGNFSSTGSTVFFTLDKLNDALRLDAEIGGSNVFIRERGANIPLLTGGLNSHNLGHGSFLYRADFRPVNNLDGVIDITFNRLFRNLPINRTVNALDLFYSDIVRMVPDPARYQIFEIGDYRVVLQFILPHTNSELRLVYFAQDMTAPAEDEADRSNRREVVLDADLVFRLPGGQTAVIPAIRSRSSQIGSNLFFSLAGSEFPGQIAAGQFANMELDIRGAGILLPDTTVSVDLDLLFDGPVSGYAPANIRGHFLEQNTHRERYSVAVLAYERVNAQTRAVIRELWFEDGDWNIVTSEIFGDIDAHTMRLDYTNEMSRGRGLYIE